VTKNADSLWLLALLQSLQQFVQHSEVNYCKVNRLHIITFEAKREQRIMGRWVRYCSCLTRNSAVAEMPRDAPCRWKFC